MSASNFQDVCGQAPKNWIFFPHFLQSVRSAIEVEKGEVRKAGLYNAHESLSKFGSEYQYLFTKLYQYKDETQLDVEAAYQVANYSRKLLEGFFKFKHPKERENFLQLMEVACRAGNVDVTVMNKVYRFINKYSHNDGIEFLESPVDNLLGESDNITCELLDILKKCDETHYKELEDICVN